MISNTRWPSLSLTITLCICILSSPATADDGEKRKVEAAQFLPAILFLLEGSAAEPITLAEASRFLTQATYGPTYEEITRLANSSYSAWLDRQFALPATLHLETGTENGFFNPDGTVPRNIARISLWNRVALDAPDQLRQRMAFALSQIFVVNDLATLNHTYPTDYYDLLVKNSFGNYRDLLERVTLHGVMGQFLGMAGSQRANPELNILRPDENFAREILQLFSIGLDELNQDGTPKLDSDGERIPTYSQSDVQEFAKVFTGWHHDYISFRTFNQQGGQRSFRPMRAFERFHDTSSKRLLKVPGKAQVLPANQSAEKDLADALDIIFNHPNVGPFIGKQLIQRFVTSNPSPAYVGRVAGVFNNNGQGVRGDLGAVLRAILMDSEARRGHLTNPTTFGKMREPILRATALWRGTKLLLNIPFGGPSSERFGRIRQSPLQAPSVFNFYQPDHSPAGKLAENGLLSPESQLLDIANIINMGSSFTDFSLRSHHEQNPNNAINTPIDTLSLIPLVPDLLRRPEALIDRLDLVYLAGTMPDEMREILLDLYNQNGGYLAASKRDVVNDMLYLVTLSPYFLVQR